MTAKVPVVRPKAKKVLRGIERRKLPSGRAVVSIWGEIIFAAQADSAQDPKEPS